MRQRIPEATIQEVLLRADLVDVIGDYVLLKKSGANYKGLCPFHAEKTPSFTVSPTKGLFYCFGCHASGNAVRFLMQHESMTFPDAVHWLAVRYGVPMPSTPAPQQHEETLAPLYAVYRAATTFFHHYLRRDPKAQAGRAYCRQRGITSDLATRFELGYAPEAWDILSHTLQQQGFTPELLVQSGLVVARDTHRRVYDRFRHRLIFPIHDRLGRPIAFGGRALAESSESQGPKYLNSPETPIFHKSRTLYGFHLAKHAIRQQERAIIVEGYTDVLACHRQGITGVVGTLGTALTEHHVTLLKGCARAVVLVFDGDSAGGAASERSIGLFLEAGLRVRIVELPAGEDPDSFLRQHTGEEFLQCVESARTFLDYLLARSKQRVDLSTPDGKADCVKWILPLVRKVDNEVERRGYLESLAKNIAVPLEALARQMSSRSTPQHGPSRQSSPITVATPHSPPPSPAEEYVLIRLLYHDRTLLKKVQHQVRQEHFQSPDLGALYTLLLGVPAEEEEALVTQNLLEAASPSQQQLLASMAGEEAAIPTNTADRHKMLHDCMGKMRCRPIETRMQRIREQLNSVQDVAEEQRLLQEFETLRKEKHAPYTSSEVQ